MTEPVLIETSVGVPAVSSAYSASAATAERGVGPAAIAMLVIGFVLAAAAQYLPWSSINLRAAGNEANPLIGDDRTVPASIDIDLASLNNGHVVVYLSTLALALVGIGVLIVTRGLARRAAAAAAVGLLAGNALVLVGFQRSIEHLGSSPYTAYSLPEEAVHVGAGYPLAVAATAMLAAGTIVAVRGLLRPGRRAPKEEPHDGSEPLELTVTPLR
ncbi:hypothetical protein OHA72_08870 [Dactylosporangium sp. NBC_01737]|uniref:hypothetical protein n=1 Tax=Dactylosporangium sp. NBC_01737 TaxID=2975959 RepID=UPI002E0ED94D|nr:hypothetical protein OHA72_08870 [Dactylosporangium sp. NBC_01737]